MRSRIVLFFVIALGWTLTLQSVPYFAGPRFLPLVGLGAFGPLIGALVCSRLEGRRLIERRPFAPGWYLVALGLFPAIYVVGAAMLGVRLLYLPESKEHIIGLIVMPLLEEPGWRGYALPRLQERFSKLTASLILGALWAVWHTFMFLTAGIAPTAAMFLLLCVNIIAGSVVFSWLYNRTNGSLLIAVLAHVSVHINNPTHALPGDVSPFVIYTAAIAVFAIGTLALDRRAWLAGDEVAHGRLDALG